MQKIKSTMVLVQQWKGMKKNHRLSLNEGSVKLSQRPPKSFRVLSVRGHHKIFKNNAGASWSPSRPHAFSYPLAACGASLVSTASAKASGKWLVWKQKKAHRSFRSMGFKGTRQRPTFPQPRSCSIIGPGGLNFRVRDGNGCGPSGLVTGNSLAKCPCYQG